jgi:hypothetical protein
MRMKPGFVAPDERHRRRRLGSDAARLSPRLAVESLAAAEDLGVGTQIGAMVEILQNFDHKIYGDPAAGRTGLRVPRHRRFADSIEHVGPPRLREQSGAGFF